MNTTIVVVGLVTLLAGCGGSQSAAPEENKTPSPAQTRFQAAYSGCDQVDRIELADEGASILADGPPDPSAFSPAEGKAYDRFIETIACILNNLNVPDYVVEQIDSTTSLMGLREATWDGIEASWSYHPDNGLDLILKDTQEGDGS